MKNNERPLLNAELLRTFVTIADCRNLTIAAGLLYRTQSAISVQVRKLEADLGASLFTRNSRGMTLTESGKKLLPKARSILTDIQQAGALFETPLTGSIRVGIPDDFNDTMLERILADFSQQHPDVKVIATSGCTSKYPTAIENDELDIAVFSGPENDKGELLETEKTVWAIKKGAAVDDMAPVPLAILDRSCWWYDLPTTSLDSIERDYTIALRSGSFASLQAAIRSGFAVGVLPASCICEKLSVLTAASGFPNLPTSRRTILRREGVSNDVAAAMTDAIKGARSRQIK